MIRKSLSVAVPWSLSHYIPLNGFHPLYRALFDHAPAGVELNGWDNIRLDNLFKRDVELRLTLDRASKYYAQKSRKLNRGSIEREYLEYFWPPNQMLTDGLYGDIEFHHTAPFPSLRRPFIFHCESFAPVFLPFSQQGSGQLENYEEIRKHYHSIFSNSLCLGIFSHIPETLQNLSRFFADDEIDRKLYSSKIGLSSKHLMKPELSEKSSLSKPRFLFINSANQNPDNFFKRGGHIVLRFWKDFRGSGRDGQLIMRCSRPEKSNFLDYDVDLSFLDVESGESIFWAEDYLTSHEMNSLISDVHFFLLPSASLHSVSIMQAMASGTVLIVTDTVGVSLYVNDSEHAVVLKGIRDTIWYTDPNTGVLVDKYRRTPELDDSLVSQMNERIIAMLEEPEAYEKMRSRAFIHFRRNFSGENFSTDFWDSVDRIYQYKEEQTCPHRTSPLIQREKTLQECILRDEDLPRVFESVTQPMLRIDSGQSVVWELGGALVHFPGNPVIELNDWSVFAQYFNQNAPKSTFAGDMDEFGGCYLSFHELAGGKFSDSCISLISRLLTPFPEVHSFASKFFIEMKHYYKIFGFYYKFISSRFNRSDSAPDIELKLSNIFGYNIIRYYHRYYAIPQSEGAFVPEKAESASYSSLFSSLSLNRVLRQICAANAGEKSSAEHNDPCSEPELVMEGINGYNIIRLGIEFHAILQSEGEFSYPKLQAGKYSRAISSSSLTEMTSLILKKSDPGSKQSEEVR